jgi:hypothetical protein
MWENAIPQANTNGFWILDFGFWIKPRFSGLLCAVDVNPRKQMPLASELSRRFSAAIISTANPKSKI